MHRPFSPFSPFSLPQNVSVWSSVSKYTYNAVLCWVSLNDLELDGTHASADQEKIALADGSVGLQEVWLQVDLEQVAGDTLDGVVYGENMDALSVLDVGAGVKGDNVSKADTQVLANNCGAKSDDGIG